MVHEYLRGRPESEAQRERFRFMMATSVEQFPKRLRTSKNTQAQGIEIQPDKTKILTNQEANTLRKLEIDVMHVEILPPEGDVKYLDQKIYSWTRKPTRCNTGSDALGPHSPDKD